MPGRTTGSQRGSQRGGQSGGQRGNRSARVAISRSPRIVKRLRQAAESAPDVAREYAPLAGFLAITAGAALLGSRFNPTAEHRRSQFWYATRRKSRLNPPPAVFGPVWGTLYVMIAVAGWRVYRAPSSRRRSQALAWWAAQMAFNGAWSPLFFGKRDPEAALVDLVAMAGSIGAFTATARKVDRRAAQLMLPYMAWVSFAGYLNATIVRNER